MSQLEEECALLRRARGPLPGAEEKEKEPDSVDLVSELRAENQRLTASLQELQEGRQQVRGVAPGGGGEVQWSKDCESTRKGGWGGLRPGRSLAGLLWGAPSALLSPAFSLRSLAGPGRSLDAWRLCV